ncbi:MAG: AAA family ATPase [Myxococcota bacterium]
MSAEQTDRAIPKLKALLETLREEKADEYREMEKAKERVLTRYQPMFALNAIDQLSIDEFKGFLRIDNNHHWTIHRQSGSVTKDPHRLREALKVLLDESLPIEQRFDSLRNDASPHRIKGMGPAIITAILHVAHPDRYGVWNNTARDAMERLGVWPTHEPSATSGQRYVAINDVLLRLATALGIDLWMLDWLWWSQVQSRSTAAEEKTTYSDAGGGEGIIRDQEASSLDGEVEEIHKCIARSLPDSEIRKKVLEIVANCVEEVASYGPRKWAASGSRQRVTLVAGYIRIFRLEPAGLDVSLSVELLTDAQRRELESVGRQTNIYKDVPGHATYRIPPDRLPVLWPDIAEAVRETVRVGASGVQQSPVFSSHTPAVLEFLERELNRRLPRPQYETPYWKVSPGEQGAFWDECRKGGFIAVGWPKLGDLSGISEKEFEERLELTADEGPGYGTRGTRQPWTIRNIPVGSHIVANRGTSEVLGFGKVTGEYYFADGDFPHRLPVEWYDTQPRVVNQPGWRRTVIPLGKAAFDALTGSATEVADDGVSGFSEETFELLQRLSQEPTRACYEQHKEAIQEQVEKPLQELVHALAKRLPAESAGLLETERGLFSRIPKNDYGRGGAWDFYWGAFYPKGAKRINNAQLFVWINGERLEYGFFIGVQGKEVRDRVLAQLLGRGGPAADALEQSLEGHGFVFADRNSAVSGEGYGSIEDALTYGSASDAVQARCLVAKDDLLTLSWEELLDRISSAFAALLPMVWLATEEQPWGPIGQYLDIEEVEPVLPTNPTYEIHDLRAETGFDADEIQRWVRVLKRKKQVILQGPPGTGKTYVAQRLAKLMVSGTPGLVDIVQFHPAYAYEDFMQGIRPKVVEGGLDYVLEHGQFLRFCREAAKRDAPSVLIIDEINRANLARVFGELMYLLEYRSEKAQLAAGGDAFKVPEKLYLIGTMNTADRSITRMDHAMRRRFAFLRLRPDYGVLDRAVSKHDLPAASLVKALKSINRAIDDPNFEVGISYFLKDGEQLRSHLPDIWRNEIEPYLDEYFYDQPDVKALFTWERLAAGDLADWI